MICRMNCRLSPLEGMPGACTTSVSQFVPVQSPRITTPLLHDDASVPIGCASAGRAGAAARFYAVGVGSAGCAARQASKAATAAGPNWSALPTM